MSGVSGISGGSGTGRIPPERNGDDDKSVNKGSIGGHEVSSRSFSESSENSSSNVQQRAQELLSQRFDVRSPEEHADYLASQNRGTNPGFLSRIWKAVRDFFRRPQQQPMEISSPRLVGYRSRGLEIPARQEFFSRLVRVSSDNRLPSDEDISSGDEGTSREVSSTDMGESTATTSAASSKISGSKYRERLSNLGSRFSSFFNTAWSRSEEHTGPLDPQHLISPEELRAMADSYERLSGYATDDSERQQMAELARDCRERAESLDSSSGGEEFVRVVGNSSFYVEDVERVVRGASDNDLTRIMKEAEEAEHILGEIDEDVRVVLESADRVVLQLESDHSLRNRIRDALRRLGESIVSMLNVIRTVIVGLFRSMKRGIVALGEAITRCCRYNEESRIYEEVAATQSSEGESRLRNMANTVKERLRTILRQNSDSISLSSRIVGLWRRGRPDSVVLGDDSVIGGQGSDGLYEIMDLFTPNRRGGVLGNYDEEPHYRIPDRIPVPQREPNPYVGEEPESFPGIPLSGIYDHPRSRFIYDIPRTSDYDTPRFTGRESEYLEIIGSVDGASEENIYEELEVFGGNSDEGVKVELGVTPGYGAAAKAALMSDGLARAQKRVQFQLQVMVEEFDPDRPPSTIGNTNTYSAPLRNSMGDEESTSILGTIRRAFGNFRSKTNQ
ncbi:hypothetical protein [Chlamydia avium]|uniref:Uncharacterized protein n=1 Tax=Chlamydia avium 10DC88 TaxID=1229831 RepID=W8JZ66_9CHLA|nr:hypothetical protein [Chlamydia avium]AHK62972.1 Uncharacterized protein M832_01020 [Chlamydia avium 10DC88]